MGDRAGSPPRPPATANRPASVRGTCSGASTPRRASHARASSPLNRFVRRHEHEHAQALADDAVDDVQEPGEPLAGPCLRIGGQQLAGVLEDEQPPAVVVPRLVEQDVEHVVRPPEEHLRIGDVVDVAPVAPLPRKRAQHVRLPEPGLAVPEQELARARITAAHCDELGNLRRNGRRIVGRDLVPAWNANRPRARGGAVGALAPELDRNLLHSGRRGARKPFEQPCASGLDRGAIVGRNRNTEMAVAQARVQQTCGGPELLGQIGEDAFASVRFGGRTHGIAESVERRRCRRPPASGDVAEPTFEDRRHQPCVPDLEQAEIARQDEEWRVGADVGAELRQHRFGHCSLVTSRADRDRPSWNGTSCAPLSGLAEPPRRGARLRHRAKEQDVHLLESRSRQNGRARYRRLPFGARNRVRRQRI